MSTNDPFSQLNSEIQTGSSGGTSLEWKDIKSFHASKALTGLLLRPSGLSKKDFHKFTINSLKTALVSGENVYKWVTRSKSAGLAKTGRDYNTDKAIQGFFFAYHPRVEGKKSKVKGLRNDYVKRLAWLEKALNDVTTANYET